MPSAKLHWLLDQLAKISFLNEIPLLFAKLMSLSLAAELKAKFLPLSYSFKDILSQNADIRIVHSALLVKLETLLTISI